jgi:hypothetical protein
VTVSDTVVVCVADVPVPVTVIVYVPAAVEVPTLTVIVELAPEVTDAGLNDTVAPAGSPAALSATLCDEPLVVAVEIVDVPFPPCATVRLLGLAAIEKSLVAVAPQPLSLNEPMRVCQLKLPVAARYSFVYQNVQSSLGSMLMLE